MLGDGQEGDEIGYVGGDNDNAEEPPTADDNAHCKLVWFVRTACKTIHHVDESAKCVSGQLKIKGR